MLRGADKTLRQIVFHTDVRSRKWTELESNPQFAAHFYDPAAKLQLRLDCIAKLDWNNETSRLAWERSRPMSRECYRQKLAPRLPMHDPREAGQDWLPAGDAFRNFAVITGRVVLVDWLYLAAAGHRRAIFDWRSGDLHQTWVAP